MKQTQTKQTIADIARLYKKDIGPVDEALEKQLNSKRNRKEKGDVFKDLTRKSQMGDLTLNQLWHLHLSLMLDWMHYQTRCIVPLYRSVKLSKNLLHVKSLAVNEIATNLSAGKSLKHRVSRTILKSLRSKKLREDRLLWNWSIHHFHLGDFDQSKGYATGTDELLFAYVDQNSAALLGFGNHKDFSSLWLFDRLFETMPELIDKFSVKGISGLAHEWSEDDRKKFWNRYVVLMPYQGQTMYPPGYGMTASGHAVRLGHSQTKVLGAISDLDKQNHIGRIDYAPIRLEFNGVELELTKGTKKVWTGQPLT